MRALPLGAAAAVVGLAIVAPAAGKTGFTANGFSCEVFYPNPKPKQVTWYFGPVTNWDLSARSGSVIETNYVLNFQPVPNGQPTWTFHYDEFTGHYLLRPNATPEYELQIDAVHGEPKRAVMFHNGQEIAEGACGALEPLVAAAPPLTPPQPPVQQYQSAPAPQYQPAPAPQYQPYRADSVPIKTLAGKGVAVGVYFDPTQREPVWMLIDTGASVMSLSLEAANILVNARVAHWTGEHMKVTIADGTSHDEPVLMVHQVRVGNHTINNVTVAITADSNAMPLLPFPILNQMGKFTIDTQAGTLTFG